ncbi:hypothetical protein HPB51_007087 [Rhipicephalus microplus]|uniref:Uncharacterized protein n=1 Tax=Rhipicephalus microplus TaxID=6941 RepID=A0A9J6E0A3_RHIMP|nr:hypothetical protein HPB51_007087 [Rhipicephalus microplus]
MSRDCLNAQQERCSKGCLKRGEEVHTKSACPNPDAGSGRGGDCFEDGGYRTRADEDTLLSTISTNINFEEYSSIPVEVRDVQFRMSFTSFEEMSLWDLPLQYLSREMVAFVMLNLHTLVRDTSLENPSYQPLQIPMVVVLSPTHESFIEIVQDAHMDA